MKRYIYYAASVCLVGILFACKKSKADSDQIKANIVEVSAMDFKLNAPEEITSGWSTFRFTNKGAQEHFFYIYQLPDTMSYDEFFEGALVPFGTVWADYASGNIDRAEAEKQMGEQIPGWFFTDLVPSGGPALTEPGEISQATVNLSPGLYVIECYVKAPNGAWHTELGMQQAMRVTAVENGAAEPEADVELMLSNYSIETKGTLKAGEQTIAVHVKENPQGFMMHDINLFRMNDSTRVEDIVKWMDWMDLEQFRAPAPAYSLGGVEHMAAGKTAYMTVNLKPGHYAWVSEGYGSKGMVKEFTVSD